MDISVSFEKFRGSQLTATISYYNCRGFDLDKGLDRGRGRHLSKWPNIEEQTCFISIWANAKQRGLRATNNGNRKTLAQFCNRL